MDATIISLHLIKINNINVLKKFIKKIAQNVAR